MSSFTVPFTDDQIDVDPESRTVRLFRNAWNRESCGIPDETHTFDALLADPDALTRLAAMLAEGDRRRFEREIRGG